MVNKNRSGLLGYDMLCLRAFSLTVLLLLSACGGGDQPTPPGTGSTMAPTLDGTADPLATGASDASTLIGTTTSGMQFSIPLWRNICQGLTSYQSSTQREICESLSSRPTTPIQPGLIGTSAFDGVAWVGEPYAADIPVSTIDDRNQILSIQVVNPTPGGAAPAVGANRQLVWTPNPADYGTRQLKLTVTPTVGDAQTFDVPISVGRRTLLHRIPVNAAGDYSDPEGDFILRVQSAGAAVSANITIQQVMVNSGPRGFEYGLEPANSAVSVDVVQEPPLAAEAAGSAATASPAAELESRKLRQSLPVNASVLVHEKAVWYGTFIPGFLNNQGTWNTWTSRQSHTLPRSRTANALYLDDPVAKLIGSCQRAADCRAQTATKNPVIFVHGFLAMNNPGSGTGFAETDLRGGGEGSERTWGDLPSLLKDRGHAVYELKWQTYIRFEEAAGLLSKATNYIFAETGKRPIVIAHSFGGVVAHAMSKGLGIIHDGNGWKQAPQHSASKIISIASPLSGISSTPSGGLSIGRDADDIWITLCKAITCLQAGGGIGRVNNILGALTAWIDPAHNVSLGSTIRELQSRNMDVEHHVMVASKWPLSVLPGGPWNGLSFNAIVRQGLFGSDGDGLIHLLGQAIRPTDFIDQPERVRDFESSLDILTGIGSSFGGSRSTTRQNKVYGTSTVFRLDQPLTSPCVDFGVYHICGGLTHTIKQASQAQQHGYTTSPSANISDSNHPFYAYLVDTQNPKYLLRSVDTNSCDPAALVCKPVVNLTGSIFLGNDLAVRQSEVPSAPARRALAATADTPAAKVLVWAEFQHKTTGETVRDTSSALTDENGRFDVDAGLILRERFGADVAIADYRAKLIVRVAGFETYLEVIENLAEGENAVGTVVLRPLTALVSFSGRVIDGQTTSTPISGAVVRLARGRDLDAATIRQKTDVNNIADLRTARRTTTNAAGQFVVPEIRPGEYSVLVTKPGYDDQLQGRLTISNNGQVSLSMLATLPGTDSAFTLRWDNAAGGPAVARDLDSHLLRISRSGVVDYHINYATPTVPGLRDQLDRDDVDYEGPETITIAADPRFNYTYYVNNFSRGATTIVASNARVTVRHAGRVLTFSPPTTGNTSALYWKVFDLVDGQIRRCVSNCLLNVAPGGAPQGAAGLNSAQASAGIK